MTMSDVKSKSVDLMYKYQEIGKILGVFPLRCKSQDSVVWDHVQLDYRLITCAPCPVWICMCLLLILLILLRLC